MEEFKASEDVIDNNVEAAEAANVVDTRDAHDKAMQLVLEGEAIADSIGYGD